MPVRPGATREAVGLFETTYDVSFPADMRDYFLKHDGMSPDWRYAKDKEGFSLWELARVRPATEELADNGVPLAEQGRELDQYFAFADYLDWSWAYAIRLTADPRDINRVVMIGTADGLPIEIASSFGEFVDLCLASLSICCCKTRRACIPLRRATLEHRPQLGKTRACRAQQRAIEIGRLQTGRPVHDPPTIRLLRLAACVERHVTAEATELEPRLPYAVDKLAGVHGGDVSPALRVAHDFAVGVH